MENLALKGRNTSARGTVLGKRKWNISTGVSENIVETKDLTSPESQ
jgi:hypothetical protein